MKKGLFITFEGGEGSGKTTVCKYICKKLKDAGYDVIYSREPGGVDIAEQIRNVILDVNNTSMDRRTEALLYAASRRQHLIEVIEPALERGCIVICDRFLDSSLAYQGYARGLGIDNVLQINQFAIDGRMPDLTLYFDIDVETGLKRVNSRPDALNRLDKEALTFHEKVHEGYNILKDRYPERIVTVDASKPLEAVEQEALDTVLKLVENNVQRTA